MISVSSSVIQDTVVPLPSGPRFQLTAAIVFALLLLLKRGSCVRKHSTDMLSSLAEILFLQKKLSQAAKLLAHQLLGNGAAQW